MNTKCLCGNKNYHTAECRRKMRIKRITLMKAKRTRERRKKHLCIDCGEKVKPITKYPAFCPKHDAKRKASIKKWKSRKLNKLASSVN